MPRPENLYLRRNRALTFLYGVIWLASCALFVFAAVMFDIHGLFDNLTDAIIFYVADGFFCAVMLVCAVFHLLNLRHRFIIYTDGKGVYHYSGFIHLGFIPWEDIGEITCVRRLSALVNDAAPRLRLIPENHDAFFKKLPFLKRYALCFGGGISVKIRTLGTRVKPEQLGAELALRHSYFTKNGTNG